MNRDAIFIKNEDLLLQILVSSFEDESLIQQPIPIAMVKGLQGTLIKQDDNLEIGEVKESDLPKVMPIIAGIADSVCYRWYPMCEVI